MSEQGRIKRLAEWMGGADVMGFVTGTPVHIQEWNPIHNIQDAIMLEDEVERCGLQNDYAFALIDIVLGYRELLSLDEVWLMLRATAAQRSAAVEKLMEADHEDR